jgi:hypothetical protein
MGVLRKLTDDPQFQALGGEFVGWFPSTRWPDDAVRLVLADPAQTTELEQLRTAGAKLLAVTEEFQQQRNLLLWLHAEAVWQRDGFRDAYLAVVDHGVALTAERDERQARIDAALKALDEPAPLLPRTDPHFERMNARKARTQLVERVRAALAGDQPTTEQPTRVPCGNPDPHCGRLGGRARCGSCTDDEPPAPFVSADQAFPEEP